MRTGGAHETRAIERRGILVGKVTRFDVEARSAAQLGTIRLTNVVHARRLDALVRHVQVVADLAALVYVGGLRREVALRGAVALLGDLLGEVHPTVALVGTAQIEKNSFN